jgi:hypothetical protein
MYIIYISICLYAYIYIERGSSIHASTYIKVTKESNEGRIYIYIYKYIYIYTPFYIYIYIYIHLSIYIQIYLYIKK